MNILIFFDMLLRLLGSAVVSIAAVMLFVMIVGLLVERSRR